MRLTALPFIPLALSVPHHPSHPRHDATCHTPAFHLLNITYQAHLVFSTPSHLAVSYARVDFGLSNPAAYDAVCSAASGGGPSSNAGSYFQSTNVYECSEQAGVAEVTGNATFRYIGFARSLEVNETWSCDGFNYFASVNLTLDLACETRAWQNPNFTWPDTRGEMYRTEDVFCTPVTVIIDSDSIAASTVQVGETEM